MDTELSFDLSGKGTQRVLKQRGIVVTISCPLEDCTMTARLRQVAGAEAPPARKAQPEAGHRDGPGRRASRREKPELKVSARVSDAAGNAVTDSLTVIAKR